MKIYTSNYRNHWISPYIILEKFFFWKKDYDAYANEPPQWLNTICKIWQKFLDVIHPRINYIKIDKYDTWNADVTLAAIIIPMLKQLRNDKFGSPYVDNSDVPPQLQSCDAPRVEYEWDIDDNFHKRWEWVLNEIIWAFEQFNPDCDWEYEYISKVDSNDKYTYDYEGMRLHQEKINNGLRLFGKYYNGMWS